MRPATTRAMTTIASRCFSTTSKDLMISRVRGASSQAESQVAETINAAKSTRKGKAKTTSPSSPNLSSVSSSSSSSVPPVVPFKARRPKNEQTPILKRLSSILVQQFQPPPSIAREKLMNTPPRSFFHTHFFFFFFFLLESC